MTSRVLTDTRKLADAIVDAIEAHADVLDAYAHARLGAELREGERWPSAGLLLRLAGRRVRRELEVYAAAERALDDERADDDEPRAERDAQALAVYTQLERLGAAVESLFGAAMARRLRLAHEPPRDPASLAHAADRVLDALAHTPLPAPRFEGVGPVDAGVWADRLAAPLARLKAARAKVNQEDRELAAAIIARDQAVQTLSEAMAEALTLARALARVADRASLFGELRATVDYSTSMPDEE